MNGWTFNQVTFKCYKVVNSHLSWIEASDTCQSLAPTGEGKPLPVTKRHLASITSEAENNFVAALLHEKVAWLGGVTLPDEKTWIWTDGSQFVFKNWKGGEPNNASLPIPGFKSVHVI